MRCDSPEIRIEQERQGWARIVVRAYWGVRIPYLPEYGRGHQHTLSAEALAAYTAWTRFVAAIAELPDREGTTLDLRYRCEPTADGRMGIALALLGKATCAGERVEECTSKARQAAAFSWRAVSGTLPPEIPLQPLKEREVADWLSPFGSAASVLGVCKRVINLGEHPLKTVPSRFRPIPTGMLQTCRALLHRDQPCLISIAITPTELTAGERRFLDGALAATLAAVPSISQEIARARMQMLSSEYASLTEDLLADLEGRQAASVGPIRGRATPAESEPAGSGLKQFPAHFDPQVAAAVRIYGQMLSAAALLAVRITIATPGEPAYEIAHALGSELAGEVGDDEALVPAGYELVEWPKGEPAKQKSGDEVAQGRERLRTLCTPHEAAAAFRLPLVCGSWVGIPSKPANPFRPASAFWESCALDVAPGGSERLRLGRIVDDAYRPGDLPEYCVSVDDLTQHVLIVGGTGSGKTTTGLQMVQQVRRCRTGEEAVHVLLIDPVKTELRPLLRHPVGGRRLLVFSAGSRFSPFHIDVFRVPDGVTPEQHLQILTGCFSAAFPMGGPLEILLTRSLRDLYRELYGDDLQSPMLPGSPRPDTPEDVLLYIAHRAKERIRSYSGDLRGNLTAAVQHRIEWLAEGAVGRAIVPRAGDRVLDIDTLVSNDVLVELRLLPGNEEKALVMALLLALIGEHYAYSLAARGHLADSAGRLRHLTWVDEAQRLFAGQGLAREEPDVANARGRAIELFVEMLSEMRSRGEGLVISTQLPSLLDPRVRKHPGMKIMHRLTPEDDRGVLGATMDLDEDQLRFITRLPAGQAVVFRGQLPAAVLVQVDDIRQEWAKGEAQGRDPTTADWLRATVVPDEEVRSSMQSLQFGRVKPPCAALLPTPTRVKHALRRHQCAACDGSCPSGAEVEQWMHARDRSLDKRVWTTFKEWLWDELEQAVSSMVRRPLAKEQVYCVLAFMAQATSQGTPLFAQHDWIASALAEYARMARISWAKRLS